MKLLSLFLFGIFFRFFDLLNLFLFVLFFRLALCLDFMSFFFSGVFFGDGVSFFLLFLRGWIFFFCFCSSLSDFNVGNFFGGFLFYLGIVFLFLFFSFSCLSFIFFYVSFEFIFLIMFLFLLSWGYSPERLQASFYIVFYTLLVSFPFLVFITFSGLSNFSFSFCGFFLFGSYWWFFIFLVFLVKLPVFGVHLWLPKAHVEAPVSGSMVLAGVLLKLGGYGFFRFSFFLPNLLSVMSGYLASFGLVGGLVSCFLCLRQVDLKSFVAYSSICHMGISLLGFYTYVSIGLDGAILMLVAHGFCSSCLFYVLYVFYERFHTRRLLILKGSLYTLPIMGLIWFVFGSLNIGVPPSLSFISEISVVVGLGYLDICGFFLMGLFLFFAGVYRIYLFVSVCHGVSFFSSVSFFIFPREFIIFYGHFFPLVYLPIFLNFYLYWSYSFSEWLIVVLSVVDLFCLLYWVFYFWWFILFVFIFLFIFFIGVGFWLIFI